MQNNSYKLLLITSRDDIATLGPQYHSHLTPVGKLLIYCAKNARKVPQLVSLGRP